MAEAAAQPAAGRRGPVERTRPPVYPPRMSAKAGWSTPMLHAASIERSIRFYRLIGFDLVDIEGEKEHSPGWARMATKDGSAIMFLGSEEGHTVKPEEQGIMLVLYTKELSALREQLVAAGEKPGEINQPFWMPSGTLTLHDPDGYIVSINQWGEAEDKAWLEQLEKKRAAGLIP